MDCVEVIIILFVFVDVSCFLFLFTDGHGCVNLRSLILFFLQSLSAEVGRTFSREVFVM